MKNVLFLLVFLQTFLINGQCDISINDFNSTTGELVIGVDNSENCGCNEFTNIGSTCDGSSSPDIGNNESISHFVLGLHIPGLDDGWTDCVDNTYHDGWSWKVKSFFGNQVLETGDTWDVNVFEFANFSNDCWNEILAHSEDIGECAELVVWQINLSQTSMVGDGGWAVNPNIANQTQNYPDIDLSNNSFLICPSIFPGCTDPFALNYNEEATEDDGIDCEEIEEPCDTVYIETIDTLYIDNFIIDTLYIDNFIIDTLYIDNYITLTDTLIEYVDVIIDNYIYETDTLTIIETQLIDCETGEECIDPPGISECWPWTVYIPNTFTPNNDGLNDTWQIIYDLDCWVDIEFKIFNRWGVQIYNGFGEDFDTYPYWNGSINGGDYYASDGVYLYTFYGRKSESPEILEESGYITIFR